MKSARFFAIIVTKDLSSMNSETRPFTVLPNSFSYRKKLNEQVAQLCQNLQGIDPRTPRGQIHDLRVLSRRMQASFKIYDHWAPSKKISRFRKLIKRVTSLVGPVRSMDVSALDLKKYFGSQKLSPPYPFLWLRDQRKSLRKDLQRAVKKFSLVRHLKKFSDGDEIPEETSLTILEVILKECNEEGHRVMKRWQDFERSKKIFDLHQVRINLKKWRYLLEIQSEFTGSPTQVHLKEMKLIQDRLGLIHDAEILRDLLKERKIRRDFKKMGKGEILKPLRDHLKSLIEKGLTDFHREGEAILLKLFTERKHA